MKQNIERMTRVLEAQKGKKLKKIEHATEDGKRISRYLWDDGTEIVFSIDWAKREGILSMGEETFSLDPDSITMQILYIEETMRDGDTEFIYVPVGE